MQAMLVMSSIAVAATVAMGESAPQASGLRGTTRYVVTSGVRGRPAKERLASLEFAVAPLQDDRPMYERAIFVRSDQSGTYEVALPPGRYWIGPKAKALDPTHSGARSVVFSEKTVVVQEGQFTDVDLVERGFAP